MDMSEVVTRHLAAMGLGETLALLRTIDLFELAGIWSNTVAHTWRTEARFRAAALSVPPAQA